jgi:hypothetical protein
MLNKVFRITFIKLLMYKYIKVKVRINCIFMVYIICLTFKAQISHTWFLKEFKVGKILCVTTFDIICISNFDTKSVHHTMETP